MTAATAQIRRSEIGQLTGKLHVRSDENSMLLMK